MSNKVEQLEQRFLSSTKHGEWENILQELILEHMKSEFKGARLSGFEKFKAQKLLDRLLGSEDTYGLLKFKKDLPDMSEQAIAARKQLYVNGAAQIVPILDRANSDFPFERRVLDERPSVQHCPECEEYARRGWVVAGSLPDIGTECSCLTNCNCRFEYGSFSDAVLSGGSNSGFIG